MDPPARLLCIQSSALRSWSAIACQKQDKILVSPCFELSIMLRQLQCHQFALKLMQFQKLILYILLKEKCCCNLVQELLDIQNSLHGYFAERAVHKILNVPISSKIYLQNPVSISIRISVIGYLCNDSVKLLKELIMIAAIMILKHISSMYSF